MSKPIGVFDSGFGGLTVASVLSTEFPEESIYYLGDTARCPYGERSQDEVKHFSFEIASWLAEHEAKMVIIACNTATAAALDCLKEKLQIPVVGVIEAGAQGSVAATRTGKIGVLATQGTVNSGAYVNHIHKLMPSAEVYQQPAGPFVRIVEDALMKAESEEQLKAHLGSPEVHDEVRSIVASLIEAQVDTVCLGCTHFPLLAETIAEEVPSGITLVNPAEGVAVAVGKLLESHEIDPGETPATYRFATTTIDTEKFRSAVGVVFPKPATSIEHVGVDSLSAFDSTMI